MFTYDLRVNLTLCFFPVQSIIQCYIVNVSYGEKVVGLVWSFAIEMQMSEHVVHDVCAKDVASMQRSCQEYRGRIKVLATTAIC